MEINITPFFAQQIAPMDLSASVAEIGRDAGSVTWAAACEAAEGLQLLTTPEQCDAFKEFLREAGAWSDEEIDAMNLQAMFLQWIAGDLREMGVRYSTDVIDWAVIEDYQAEGVCACNIGRGDDGAIYFCVGV